MELLLPALAAVAILLYVLWQLFREFFVSSPLDNLPGPSSSSFLQGNIPDLFKPNASQHLAETYGPVSKLRAILGARMLLVHDPRALHSVFIKDSDNYPKCPAPFDDFVLLMGPSVLTTNGAQHRKQRRQLNPVFSLANLRNMTGIFYHIAHRLRKAIEYRVESSEGGQIVDVNGWMGRTTLEMLGQAALGYSFDNFVDDSSDAFGESLRAFFPTYARVMLLGFIIPPLSWFVPLWLCRAILRAIPHPDLREMMRISDTMAQRSLEIVNERKMALMKGDDALKEKIGEGKDLMSILLKANVLAQESDRLTDEELVAQMSTFMLAGMDTTSNALTRTLQVLAEHPSAQDRLRAEIIEARQGNDISYDALDKLPYLDAVCRETLRLYAPVNIIGRAAAKDMKLPLHTPVIGKDGSATTEVPVPQGTWIFGNLQASNCNRALWGDDAYEWKPERWLKPLPNALEDARIPGVYSHLLSFAGGGRSCIGFKLSQIEMKIVLSILLSSFKFETTGKPIVWKTSGVSYPTMGEDSSKPELLLRVTKVDA
ncbi:cytochrome P450 [Pilatotrama ljubarskyi]|nr:cytochrome P450 [Pilatotrama ljubarskyi]